MVEPVKGAAISEVAGGNIEACWIGPNGADNQCLSFTNMVRGVLDQGANIAEHEIKPELEGLADTLGNFFDNFSAQAQDLVSNFKGGFHEAVAGIAQNGLDFHIAGLSISIDPAAAAPEKTPDIKGPNTSGPGGPDM